MFLLEDPHLDLLSRRLRGLAARRPGFALTLCGEAGIGKSFTARKLLQACSSASFSTPATRPLSSVLCALPRPKRCPAPLEGTLGRLKRDEILEPQVILDALCILLAALAPFVLYVEDLHEASSEQLEVWSRLAERVTPLRGVALLSSSRNAPPAGFEVLHLERLSPTQSRELLEAEVHTALSPEALGWIYSKAAGNPLYTLEFFRSLSRAGNAWSDGQRWHWRAPPEDWVPVSVEALIERILLEAAQTPDVQAALETLALLPEADVDLQCAVSQLERPHFETALTHLRARGVLQESGFAHPLYREMTLKDLSPGSRKTLSRRALEALEVQDIEAAAGFVSDAALDQGRALELLKRASANAKARGDTARAGHFLAQAVEFASGTERGELALEAAQFLIHISVLEAYRLAQQAAQTEELHLEATFIMVRVLAAQNREQEAEALLAQLDASVRSSQDFTLRMLHLRGMTYNFKQVLVLVNQNPELLDAPDAPTVLYAARALASSGHLERAETLAYPALERITDPLQRALVQRACSHIAYIKGDFAAMERLEAEILHVAEAHHDLRLKEQALFNRSLALLTLGHYSERRQCLEQAMAVCRELGDTTAFLISQIDYACALADFGEYQRAEDLLGEARAFFGYLGATRYLLTAERHLILLYLEWQPLHGSILALRYARSAVQHARTLEQPFNLVSTLCLVALTQIGVASLEPAQELAHEALELALSLGNAQCLADAWETVGKIHLFLGQHLAAFECFSKAYRYAEELEDPKLLHTLGLELDHLRGDLESARARLAWFEAKGLVAGRNLASRLFPQLDRPEFNISERGPQTSADLRTSEPFLRLEVLGPLRLGGQLVRGGKRQDLLRVLLEARIAGRQEVSTLELLEALYPGVEEEHALSALKQSVYNARSSGGPGLLKTTPGGYALGSVSSDAEDFLGDGDTRRWHGAYRPIEGSAAALETLSLALQAAMQKALERDPQEAARAARILCEMDPYSLKNLKVLCTALQVSGNYKSLAREYEKGRVRLLEVGETLPRAWHDFLGTSVPA